ncbi:MAG: biliverdin-producing heme oxygenase [Phycisphaerae bacterium]
MLQSATGIMARLKNDTLEHHKRAESKPLERALVRGAISRELYCDYLTQRLHIHEALDAAVRRLCETDSRLGELMSSELYQTPRLRDDLRSLGVDATARSPHAATVRLIADLDSSRTACATSLLGAYYVFEGSKNGARFISRALRPALGLMGPTGWSYLDPHAEQQSMLWGAFKQRVDAIEFTEVEMNAMVALAAKTFDRIGELDDEIWGAHASEEATPRCPVTGR